jgi:hypothetical protein
MEENQVEWWKDLENTEENCEMIGKIWKKIVIRHERYGRKASWNVKWYGKYWRKISWIVKWLGKYGRKASRIVIRYGQYRRKVSRIVKR